VGAMEERMSVLMQLHIQHEQLRELAQVLLIMGKHEGLRHTKIYLELFERIEELIKAHLDLENTQVYAELLQNSEGEIKLMSHNLCDGAQYLKKLFHNYHTKQKNFSQRSTVDPTLEIHTHRERRDMLRLLLEHITLEEQYFFPLLHNTQEDMRPRGHEGIV
jgi:hypothetical protein